MSLFKHPWAGAPWSRPQAPRGGPAPLSWRSRRPFASLLATLLVANLLAWAMAGYELHQRRLQIEGQTLRNVQDLAYTVDGLVSGSLREVDLVLLGVVDELQRELAANGRLDPEATRALLARQGARLPQVDAIRASDERGQVLFGPDAPTETGAGWGDRPFFGRQRDRRDLGLVVTPVLRGRVSGLRVIALTRRYEHADGSFAGVVSAAVPLDYFERLLGGIELGPNGAAVLRDDELGLVARFPDGKGTAAGRVGDGHVSPQLRALLLAGTTAATYHAVRTADGIEREVAYRRLRAAPFVLTIGRASVDYLAPWHAQIARTVGFLALFLLTTASLGTLVAALWRREQRVHASLVEATAHARVQGAALETAGRAIAIANADGIVEWINPAYPRLTGYGAGETVGWPLVSLLFDDGAEGEAERLRTTLRSGSIWRREARQRRRDGSAYEEEQLVTPVRDAAGRIGHFVAIRHDITSRRQREERIGRLNRVYAFLTAIQDTIIRARDPAVLFGRICEVAVEVGGFRAALVAQLDPAAGVLFPVAQAGPWGDALKGRSFPLGDGTGGLIGGAFLAAQRQLSNDLAADDRLSGLRDDALALGFRSKAAFPLVVDGQPRAIVAFFADVPGFFDTDEVRLLEGLTAELGFAIGVVEADRAARRTQERLRESEQRFSSIFQHSPHAIGLGRIDERGRTIAVDINEAWLAMFGYARDEVIGRPFRDLRLYGDPAERDALERPLREAGSVRNVEVRVRHRSGREAVVLQSMERVSLAGIDHMLVMRSDITARKQAEAELERHRGRLEELVAQRTAALVEERERAEQLARVKTEFLANMSHEIRTPLNAVLGFAQIGSLDRNRHRAPELFGRILKSGEHLLDIINDILDFSKIDAGMLRIENGTVDTGMLMHNAEGMIRPAAEAKGLALVVEREAGTPETFAGDALRLSQVLVNLLSNAVKFTPAGRVTLTVRGCEGAVAFVIADTGIGIEPADLARLFQPFEQADRSTSRRYGGTGLGLAISKRLVEAMGGEIRVDTTPGSGSRFEVRVPAS